MKASFLEGTSVKPVFDIYQNCNVEHCYDALIHATNEESLKPILFSIIFIASDNLLHLPWKKSKLIKS
jgi:hypothetical protein